MNDKINTNTSQNTTSKVSKDAWASRIGLILAMAGSAVGLGNFLRFPIQAIQNGGGAFIIPYLVCFILLGIPLLWVEWAMGRFGGKNGHHSTAFIVGSLGKSPYWKYLGVFSIFINVAVAGYYCYIESWTMAYTYHSLVQTFDGKSQTEVANFFHDYVDFGKSTTGIPYEPLIFYIICLVLNIWVLSKGIKDGIEKVSKYGMPLLIIFGIFLAIRGLTLGDSGAYQSCKDCDATLGINFLWNPQYESLWSPKTWLAAAGQIFFTLAIGMGTIQCYAAYIKANEDVALNAMSAGWTNEFVEVVLGASIVIPISVGYLGLDWVKENASFAMGFQTMPYLFSKWGVFFGTLAGLAWFGLLFFAGITSSLAMGMPIMGILQDRFKWSREKSAWTFGAITLFFGLPTVLFYQQGVLDEYDYWAGSVALVIFALCEIILFAWIFGIDKGWKEITEGADIAIPTFFKFIIKYITPLILLFVFIGSLIQPKDNDWQAAFSKGWELDKYSIIGKIMNKGVVANKSYQAAYFESEVEGFVKVINEGNDGEINGNKIIEIANKQSNGEIKILKTYTFSSSSHITTTVGAYLKVGDKIAEGNFTNTIFYTDFAKFLLILLLLFSFFLIYKAGNKEV
jgi:NSS family neurotransmitter:Na+ symporter